MDEGGDCLGNNSFRAVFITAGASALFRALRVMSSAERNKWWMLDLLLAWPLLHSDHKKMRIAVRKDVIGLWRANLSLALFRRLA